jgi:hypothetical protein
MQEEAKELIAGEKPNAPATHLVAYRAGEISPAAIPELASQLADAVENMRPDDVSVELDAKRDGDRTSLTFKFRAYRRARVND